MISDVLTAVKDAGGAVPVTDLQRVLGSTDSDLRSLVEAIAVLRFDQKSLQYEPRTGQYVAVKHGE